jgi:hypothetical protein
VLSVGGGVVLGGGTRSDISLITVNCGIGLCRLFLSPSISTSAFLTAITIGVFAVAVSKFSIYLRRFL